MTLRTALNPPEHQICRFCPLADSAGGVLVQLMIHRTRRHLTQNIADLAEAAVKIGDTMVMRQIAQLISREAEAQSPKPRNRRRRYEAAIVILTVTVCTAVGTVGAMF